MRLQAFKNWLIGSPVRLRKEFLHLFQYTLVVRMTAIIIYIVMKALSAKLSKFTCSIIKISCWHVILDVDTCTIPSSHGAHDPSMPFWADLSIVSGSGSECRTIAPYSPYSAMMVDLPHVFAVLRHFARLFWNHTYIHHVRMTDVNFSTLCWGREQLPPNLGLAPKCDMKHCLTNSKASAYRCKT